MTTHGNAPMAGGDDWQTVNVTALPPGISVTVQHGRDETDRWRWPAVALLHQSRGDDVQVVLGVLNTSGEVEPCYSGRSDDNRHGLELVHLDYGPYMKTAAPQPIMAGGYDIGLDLDDDDEPPITLPHNRSEPA
jgi:hypothetical protein